jgi:DNA-binding transcriptional LysR family regulator
MLEHRQLKYFLSIIRQGNFRKAANALHITPPALTKSIQQLEERLGVELFDREYGSAKPTVFGQLLAKHAHTLITTAEDIENHIAQIANLEGGLLSVGGGIIASDSMLRKAVVSTFEQFPKLRFDILIDNWSVLEKKLEDGDIEFYVGWTGNIDKRDNMEITELRHDSLFLLCGSQHPLLKKEKIIRSDIIRYPMISSSLPLETKRKLERCFGADYSARLPHIFSNSLSLIKSTIMHSNHLTLGTQYIFEDDIRSKNIKRVPIDVDLGITKPGIVYMKNRTLSPAANQLITELKKDL